MFLSHLSKALDYNPPHEPQGLILVGSGRASLALREQDEESLLSLSHCATADGSDFRFPRVFKDRGS